VQTTRKIKEVVTNDDFYFRGMNQEEMLFFILCDVIIVLYIGINFLENWILKIIMFSAIIESLLMAGFY